MNQLRLLLLPILILLSASSLLGQAPSLPQGYQFGTPAVCNDGKIPFSVARAARDSKDTGFGSDEWVIQGWYTVDPLTCTQIGERMRYDSGGVFGEDSVSLLALAFFDSKGVWRGIKVPGGEGWFYPISPSNQQICVPREVFEYTRNSPKQIDLARECDRARTGYMLIPVSFMYKGSTRQIPLFGGEDESPDYIHITIGPDDRAVTSGHPSGSAGISQGLGGGGTPHSDGDASPSLCGKVSCWDLFLQGLNEAAKNDSAQRAAANAKNNPPPPVVAPRAVVSPAPAPAPAVLPRRPHPAPIMVGKADVSHLAGLQRDDTAAYVASLFGPPASKSEQDSSGFGGYLHRGSDGSSIRVNYDLNNVLSRIKVYSRGSRGTDPLLDLLGKNEAAAVALLGAPKLRESLWNIDQTDMVWSFPLPGRPAAVQVEPEMIQSVTLHFRTGVGCESISVIW